MVTDQPKRRWNQFSLLTLLVVMLVACAGFAWIGVRLRQARKNRDRVTTVETAVTEIEKLGSKVYWFNKERPPQTWLESQFDDPGDAEDPVRVLEVEAISRVRQLTDAGLEHLKDMKSLEFLSLRNANCTDAGLENLKGLSNLQFLDLVNTDVTDAGLEHLKGLSQLNRLDLWDTKVTKEGVRKLRKALPNCFIASNHYERTENWTK
jgi:hypothetical protein